MSDEFETLVGRICLEKGWVTQDQLIQCLKECGSTFEGHSTKLSDILVGKGFVKGAQLEAIRKECSDLFSRSGEFQILRRDDILLGQMLIKRKRATAEAVKRALSQQELESKRGGPVPRLGELLVKMGATSFSAIEEVLASQKEKVTLACPVCRAVYAVAPFDPQRNYLCKKCSTPLARPDDAASMAKTVTKIDEQPKEVKQAATNPKNVIGKYVVVKELGRGGMGAVYKAWDGGLKRWVALKLLTAQGEGEELARFEREAQTAASLKHPTIVGIYEVGEFEDKHFIAMEYVDGHTLVGERLPVRKVVELMAQVVEAVEYAHSRGIVHRDLKPHNIMIDSAGHPFVMDFGLAKSLKGESQITMSGTVIGTPSYMAPEQAQGKLNQVDKRSDIYSLGAVIYEMLTGRPPFKGGTPVETLRRVVNEDPTPPREIVKTTPQDVDTIVLKCLEKEKARRYPSARLLAEDLRRWLAGEPIAARPVSIATRVGKRLSKNKLPFIAASAVALALVIVVAVLARNASEHKADFAREIATADEAFKRQDYVSALAAYQSAHRIEPTPEVKHRIAECKLRIKEAQDRAKAEQDQRDLEKKAASEKEEWRKKAREKAQPRYDAGQHKIEEARRDLYRTGAQFDDMRYRIEEAVNDFTEAIKLCPDFHEAYLGRGTACMLLFRPEDSEKDFTEAIRLLPSFSAALVARGRLYLARYMELVMATEWMKAEAEREDVRVWREKAWADFKRAESLGNLGETAEFLRANVLYAEERYSETIDTLTKLIQRSKNEEYFKLRGDAEWGLAKREGKDPEENVRKAAEDYSQAILLCTNYYEARRYRGALLWSTGNAEAAYEDFSAGLKINPTDSYALSDMATYLQKNGQEARALELYNQAISSNPRNFRAWANRATIKLGKKDYRSALVDVDEALKINSHHLPALYSRAVAHFYLGSESAATEELKALVRENPQFAQGYMTLGDFHALKERWKDALEAYQACVRADPRYAAKVQSRIDEARRRLGD